MASVNKEWQKCTAHHAPLTGGLRATTIFPSCSQSRDTTSAAATQQLQVEKQQLIQRRMPDFKTTEHLHMLSSPLAVMPKQKLHRQRLYRTIAMWKMQYLSELENQQLSACKLVPDGFRVERPLQALKFVTRAQMSVMLFCINRIPSDRTTPQLNQKLFVASIKYPYRTQSVPL